MNARNFMLIKSFVAIGKARLLHITNNLSIISFSLFGQLDNFKEYVI